MNNNNMDETIHPISQRMRRLAEEGRRSMMVQKELQEAEDWEQVKEILKNMGFQLTVHGPAGRYKISW
jgi:uncharacterized lipoprotein